MKNILTLCINLFILLISDAVAVKLIEGEHTIVKKDGATHTISKYYVVPNDYDPNKNTDSNTTKASERRTLRMSLNSKSMDSGVSETNAESNITSENNDEDSNTSKNDPVNNSDVSFRSDQNDTQVKVQAGDYTAETMESVSTEQNLEGDGFISLLVEPLTKSINISSNVTVDIHKTDNTLKNQTRSIVENATDTSEANFDDDLDDLILTKFGIAVPELSTQNIKSFWKLVKLHVESTSDDTELFTKLKRLSLLLSIFTNLYQVAQSQNPFESMIHSIIDILHIPLVKKRNTNESQSETVFGKKYEDPHLASNGINLIESEGRKPSPQLRTSNFELNNPDLQKGLAGSSNNAYTLSNSYYDDRRSNEITDDTEPLPDPYNLKVGAPDVYNVRSAILQPTSNRATRDEIQADSKPNQPFSDSSETDEEQDDLPITIKSRFSNNHPLPNESEVTKQWIIEDKSPKSKVTRLGVVEDKSTDSRVTEPWIGANKLNESRETRPGVVEDTLPKSKVTKPWIVEDNSPESGVEGTDDDQPSSIQSRFADDQPSTTAPEMVGDQPTTASRFTDDQPLTNVSGMAEGQPLSRESDMIEAQPLTIESRFTTDPLTTVSGIPEDQPLTIVSRISDVQPLITESEKDEGQPLATETRVTQPLIFEDKWTENIPSTVPGLRTADPRHIEDKTTHKLPWIIKDITSDKLPWHIADKTINQGPWTITHKTTTIPWIIEDRPNKNVPWNVKYNEIGQSPTTLYQSIGPDITTNNGKILLDPNQPSIVKRVKNTVQKPYHIYTYVIKPKTTLYEMPTTDKIVNVKYEQPNSNLLTKSSSYNGNKVVYKPSSYESRFPLPTIKINSQTGNSPLKHTNYITSAYDKRNEVNPSVILSDSPQDNNQPKYVVEPGIEPNPKPELLLTSETQTNSEEDNDGPQISPQHPSYISHASAPSEFIIPNEYHNPTVANSGVLDQHPGLMHMVPYHPENTNTAENYEEPYTVHDEYTDHRPEVAHQSEYTDVLDDHDEPTPVSDENTPLHTSYISHASDNADVPTSNEYHNPTATYSQDIDPSLVPMVSYHPKHINSAENYEELTPVDNEYTGEHTGLVPKITHQPEYTIVLDDYGEPIPVSGENKPQHLSYISHEPAHSEFTNIPNDYNSANVHQLHAFGPTVPDHPEYSDTAENYEEPNPVNDEYTEPHPRFAVKVPHQTDYTQILHDYDESTPVYDEKPPQHPGYVLHASAHATPNEYHNPTSTSSENMDQHPSFIAKVPHESEYTNILDDYGEPTQVSGENKPQHPGYISHASAHSEFTNIPNYYNSGNIHQHPDFGPMVPYHPEYSNTAENYEEPNSVNDEYTEPHPGSAFKVPHQLDYTNILDESTPVYGEKTPQRPGYVSHASAQSEVTIPNEYNYPIPDKGQGKYIHAGSTETVLHTPEHINIQDEYGKRIPVQSVDTVQHPHSEYTNLPNDYIGDDESIYTSPNWIQNGPPFLTHTDILNGDIARPTLVDGGHTVHTVQPSFVAYLHGKQPKKLHDLKKVKMPQTYQLFTLGNVLKLHDAIIKAIELSNGDDSDYRALINLSKIVKLILIVAEHFDKPEGKNEWYKNIFLNAAENRHPLQLYVYNLIRQRWLHELMLILLKKNFDNHILQNPRIFSFLGSWKFPKYVQTFLKAEDLIQNDLDAPIADETLKDLPDWFSSNTYDDLVEGIPGGLENYVANRVIQNYQVPNDGIVVSIAGVEAEPEAHAIISIIKEYLHYKKIIKNQENVIIHDNKLGMLKRIALYLKQKGYDPDSISDLIGKLYSAVYLAEGKECQPHHPQFAKNMFDIILPVLRRSGR